MKIEYLVSRFEDDYSGIAFTAYDSLEKSYINFVENFNSDIDVYCKFYGIAVDLAVGLLESGKVVHETRTDANPLLTAKRRTV